MFSARRRMSFNALKTKINKYIFLRGLLVLEGNSPGPVASQKINPKKLPKQSLFHWLPAAIKNKSCGQKYVSLGLI